MELDIAKIVFFAGHSILFSLMVWYIAKFVEGHPDFLNVNWKKGHKLRLFMIKYYWIIGIIVFLILILLSYLR